MEALLIVFFLLIFVSLIWYEAGYRKGSEEKDQLHRDMYRIFKIGKKEEDE